jgi:hypothetical protein
MKEEGEARDSTEDGKARCTHREVRCGAAQDGSRHAMRRSNMRRRHRGG